MKPNFRLLPAIIISAFLVSMFTTASAAPAGKENVGLQLYSLRNQLGSNVPGALDEIKS